MPKEVDKNLKPIFSVIMPVHNKGPHIQRAVNSVLAQSFQNFEIVMVDDASTDDSFEIMSSIADPRVKVLRRDTPGPGGYAGRNHAIKHANGLWAAFLDADDEWLPDHLERFAQLTIKFPDAHLLGAGWRTVDGTGEEDCRFYTARSGQGSHQLSLIDYLKLCLQRQQRAVHTSIAAVKLDGTSMKELFPAGRGAKRGGDLFAWIKVLAKYKTVAWSNHIGALYHVDSVNMVTKNAISSPNLWNKESLNELTGELDTEEKKWMGRYFNNSLKNGWVNNSLNGHSRSGFWKGLNKNAGLKSYLKLKVFMLTPRWGVKLLKKAKDSV